MRQVCLYTQLFDLPAGKLAAEHFAKALPEDSPRTAAAEIGAGGFRQIDEVEASFPAGEALHHQFHPAARFRLDAGDAPDQVAVAVPSLQDEARAAGFEHEISVIERHHVLARLEQGWLSGGFEE